MWKYIRTYIKAFGIRLVSKFGYEPSKKPIPEGLYCYDIIESPTEKNGHVMRIEQCPYFRKLDHGKTACLFLGHAGYDPAHFDQCKICDEKNPSQRVSL